MGRVLKSYTNMKKSTTNRESATSFGFTMQPGASSYPIAYADKIWDIAVAGSELKAMMSGTAGQYGQEEINERVAAIVNAVRGILYEADGETPKSLGNTYEAGTGIEISQQDAISVKEATNSERGGMKIAPDTERSLENTFPVGLSSGVGVVGIPASTDSQTGLMSAADHRRLNTHAFTVDFGANQDSVTVLHMDAACRLVRVVTKNVSSVTVSVVNGGSVTPTLSGGSADLSLACPAEAGIVIDIVRTASGNAAVGVRYELE